MLWTPLCDLLGTEVPIICAPFGPWEQVDLAAAVCNAGGAAAEGRLHELLPFTGQSAALVHDIAPAATLIARIIAEAEVALRRAQGWLGGPATG